MSATVWSRVPLGLFFLMAGLAKVQSPDMFAEAVKGIGFAGGALDGIVIALLPWVELIGGAALLVGLYTQWAALLISLTLLAILIATGWTQPPMPFSINVILLGTSLSLMFTGSQFLSVDSVMKKK